MERFREMMLKIQPFYCFPLNKNHPTGRLLASQRPNTASFPGAFILSLPEESQASNQIHAYPGVCDELEAKSLSSSMGHP